MSKKIGDYIDIEFDDSYFNSDRKPKINWSAIGSVDIEIAEKFLKDLQEAIKEAKRYEQLEKESNK
jgi:hypothetical protein